MIRVACILMAFAVYAHTAPVDSVHTLRENGHEPLAIEDQSPSQFLHRLTSGKRIQQQEEKGYERKLFVVRIPCDRNDDSCTRSQVFEFDLLKGEPIGNYGTSSRDYY